VVSDGRGTTTGATPELSKFIVATLFTMLGSLVPENWVKSANEVSFGITSILFCDGETRGGTSGGTAVGAFNFNLFKSKLLLLAWRCGLK